MTSMADLRVPTEYEGLDGSKRLLEVNSAQLHGRACAVCDTEAEVLEAVGHVFTKDGEGGRHGWAVVACPQHLGCRL